jgi:hypothetical protein
MKTLTLIPALVLLAACQMDRTVPAPDPMPPIPAPDACGPDLTLIGQPESVLAAMTFPMGTRIYRTGDAVTMDYNPGRLNIEIGETGQIVMVYCG